MLGDSMVVFGGRASPVQPLGDLWVLDLPSMAWTAAAMAHHEPQPCARFRHTAVAVEVCRWMCLPLSISFGIFGHELAAAARLLVSGLGQAAELGSLGYLLSRHAIWPRKHDCAKTMSCGRTGHRHAGVWRYHGQTGTQ